MSEPPDFDQLVNDCLDRTVGDMDLVQTLAAELRRLWSIGHAGAVDPAPSPGRLDVDIRYGVSQHHHITGAMSLNPQGVAAILRAIQAELEQHVRYERAIGAADVSR